MDELKPCPFCGGKAAIYGVDSYFIACCRCEAQTKRHRTAKEAAATWNRRAATENKPLTLEQIKRLEESAWLWIEDISKGQFSAWHCGYYRKDEDQHILNSLACNGVFTYLDLPYENYGKTWLAYARKPEGSETK